jgi:hypothetical protein
MRLLLGLYAAALLAGAAFAAEPPARLSADSTLMELAQNPVTASVLNKRMPGLVERLLENEEVATIFGGSTLRNLVVDPHFKGLTPAIVDKIDLELAAAQAAAPAAQTPSR